MTTLTYLIGTLIAGITLYKTGDMIYSPGLIETITNLDIEITNLYKNDLPFVSKSIIWIEADLENPMLTNPKLTQLELLRDRFELDSENVIDEINNKTELLRKTEGQLRMWKPFYKALPLYFFE